MPDARVDFLTEEPVAGELLAERLQRAPLSPAEALSHSIEIGIALGKGQPPSAAHALAEGVFTAPVLTEMADAEGIEMPIASAVVAILEGRASVDEATETLLTRPFRSES